NFHRVRAAVFLLFFLFLNTARIGTQMQITSKPRLRHCTLVATGSQDKLAMIVGKEHFELTAENGMRDTFLKIKRYLDGRHTLSDISERSGVALGNVKKILMQFDRLGLLRADTPTVAISTH